MNAKTCKKLRRVAAAATVGLPMRSYTVGARGNIHAYGFDWANKVPLNYKAPDQVVLDSACTRAAYRQLKAQVRGTPT